jgi:hypothetical protein
MDGLSINNFHRQLADERSPGPTVACRDASVNRQDA